MSYKDFIDHYLRPFRRTLLYHPTLLYQTLIYIYNIYIYTHVYIIHHIYFKVILQNIDVCVQIVIMV